MALTTLPTAALADDAVDNTKLDLAANYAFTGTVTGASDMVKLHSITASSGDASIVFDNTYMTTTYKNYYLVGYNMKPVTNAVGLQIFGSANNGSDSLTHYCGRSYTRTTGVASHGGEIMTTNTTGVIIGWNLGNDGVGMFDARLTGFGSTGGNKFFFADYHGKHDTEDYRWNNGGIVITSSAINYIKIYYTSGNIESGTVSLYGLVE